VGGDRAAALKSTDKGHKAKRVSESVPTRQPPLSRRHSPRSTALGAFDACLGHRLCSQPCCRCSIRSTARRSIRDSSSGRSRGWRAAGGGRDGGRAPEQWDKRLLQFLLLTFESAQRESLNSPALMAAAANASHDSSPLLLPLRGRSRAKRTRTRKEQQKRREREKKREVSSSGDVKRSKRSQWGRLQQLAAAQHSASLVCLRWLTDLQQQPQLQQEFEDRMICREERRRGPTDSRKETGNK